MVNVASRKRVKEPDAGTWTVLTFTDGTTAKLIRLNSTESMGIPGWHVDEPTAMFGMRYLADTEKDAIANLLRRKNG